MIIPGGSGTIAATGTYTGDGSTQNRAIAHTLGRVPKLLVVQAQGSVNQGVLTYGSTYWLYNNTNVSGAVTTPTSSNFYVGATNHTYAMNVNATTYTWVAI